MAYTSNYELIRFPNPETLAKSVAVEWLRTWQTDRPSGTYCLALSGGRIARLLFSAMTELLVKTELKGLHFFWADERCVPPSDPESNFAVARELLLDPLKVPADQIHRVRGEKAPKVAAVQASAELRAVATARPEGDPVIDLVFLGMGEDGHVASLFPGEPPEVKEDRSVYRAVVATKPPPHRVTIGYSVLAAARQVWVLASGPGKEKALRESLAPEGRTPLAEVLRWRNQTRVFSDIPLE